MKIYFGSSVKHLKEKATGLNIGKIQISKFPNQETYVRILDDLDKKEKYLVVQSTRTDSDIVELLLILDGFNDYEIKPNVLIPYYGYGKQDKKFRSGEVISAKAIAKMIYERSANIYTINPHFHVSEGKSNFYDIKLESLSAIPLLSEKIEVSKPYLVAPDEKAGELAMEAAKIMKADYVILKKERGEMHGYGVVHREVEEMEGEIQAQGKDTIIIDDFISTGGTIVKAVEKIKPQKPKSIIICAIHGLFARNAIEKIKSVGVNKIITTDTIKNPFSVVSITSLIKNIINLDKK